MSMESETMDNNIDSIIKYNQELTEKQKVQKDKIELIKDKEANLIKVNSLLKSSNDRNNFKRKIIYTLVAFILLLFVLCLSTYIYFVRDFKPDK
jgi:lipopolysaccharide export LptBFGC system permease protein LptF